MTGFWAGTIPPWAWVLYVAAAGIFLILVIVAELHGRTVGYRQHEEDQADARHEAAIRSWRVRSEAEGVAMVKAAGMRAWELTHSAELEPLPVSSAGYLRGLDRVLAGVTTNLARDPDDPYDPDEDPPFTVGEEWSVPLEYPPAPERLCENGCGCRYGTGDPESKDCACDGPCCMADDEVWFGQIRAPAYAWEPWSLSAGTTLEEEVRAMIANADASLSVRWLAGLEDGQ
jgi:hypothetical protein